MHTSDDYSTTELPKYEAREEIQARAGRACSELFVDGLAALPPASRWHHGEIRKRGEWIDRNLCRQFFGFSSAAWTTVLGCVSAYAYASFVSTISNL